MDTARRARVSEPYLYHVEEDLTVQTRRPRANETNHDTLLVSAADAAQMNAEVFSLVKEDRSGYEVQCTDNQWRLQHGNSISLTFSQWGLNRSPFIVLGLGENSTSRQTRLRLWG